MSTFYGPNNSHLFPDPRYHSSVLYAPSQIEHLNPSDIQTWTCPISDLAKENFDGMLGDLVENNSHLNEGHLCSYIKGTDIPIGTVVSVWWFNPDKIELLVQLENEQQVRVFPRYVHKMTWYEKYDSFCWRYKLYQEYLAGLKNSADETYNALSEYAYQEDINLQRFMDANPDITRTETIEFMELHAQQVSANDIQAASEFLDLLVNYDPAPWDIPGAMSDFYKGIWKSINPFRGASVPTSMEECDPEAFKPRMSDTEVMEMADKVRSHIIKSHVQEWAVDNHQDFIKDYISLARRSDFSYGYVWDLKCRYLKQLYSILDKASVTESRYAIFPEGPTWTVIYNGNALRGLKGNGYLYIQYLVKNPGQQYHTSDINKLDGIIENPRTCFDKNLDTNRKKSSHEIKTDEKAAKQYRTRLKELKIEREKAEQDRNMAALDKINEEFDYIDSVLKKDFSPKGTPRNFRDDSDKIKDRIVQAIRRAVLSIQKHDPEAGEHFQEALKPINSFQQCYKPDKQINWKFND
jgi:hypothetical protein